MAPTCPDDNLGECRRGRADCRGGNRRQRSTAEFGGSQRRQQYVLLPPPGSAFGSGVVDRTPSFAISPDARRLVFAASSPGIGPVLASAPRCPHSGSDPGHGRRGVTLLVSRRSFSGVLCGREAEAREPRRRYAADHRRCVVGVWRHLEPKRRHRLCADTSRALVACGGGRRKPTAITRLGAGDLGHVRPQFLPDGQHFLYLVRAARRAAASTCRRSTQPSRDTLSPHANGHCTLRAICCSSARGDCSGSRSMQRGWSCQAMRFLWSIRSPLFRRKDARRMTCRTTAR